MTRYVVQRLDVQEFWCGGNRWTFTVMAARWFDSVKAAELAALRELPDARGNWAIRELDQHARGVLTAIKRICCALRGHETILHFEIDRVSLRCLQCFYQSPGWRIDPPRRLSPAEKILRFRKRMAAC